MNPEDFTKEYILVEVKKLQYLYSLKKVIRYGRSREKDDLTESVAEHLYGMQLLAHYFLPLENPTQDWNALRIFSMITIHDLDEIETGDTIGYLKTPEIYALEAKAEERVFNNLPTHLQEPFGKLMNEYKSQTSKEANFVKAIDRIEPLFQTYSQFGKTIFSINKTRLEDSIRIKDRFIRPFPVLYRYYTVLQQQMVDEGYFHKE